MAVWRKLAGLLGGGEPCRLSHQCPSLCARRPGGHAAEELPALLPGPAGRLCVAASLEGTRPSGARRVSAAAEQSGCRPRGAERAGRGLGRREASAWGALSRHCCTWDIGHLHSPPALPSGGGGARRLRGQKESDPSSTEPESGVQGPCTCLPTASGGTSF